MLKVNDEDSRVASINHPKAVLFPPTRSHPHKLNALKILAKELYICEFLEDVLETTEKVLLSEKRVLFISIIPQHPTPLPTHYLVI